MPFIQHYSLVGLHSRDYRVDIRRHKRHIRLEEGGAAWRNLIQQCCYVIRVSQVLHHVHGHSLGIFQHLDIPHLLAPNIPGRRELLRHPQRRSKFPQA